jgi:hypothetical protein
VKWNLLNPDLDSLTIFATYTNNFSSGGVDQYQKIKTLAAREAQFWFKPQADSSFTKILIKTPNQYLNAWLVKN